MQIARTNNQNLSSTSRSQALQPGQYWRSLKDHTGGAIEAGEVLLIESIRWVDDKPHTIVLRAHPSKFGQSVPNQPSYRKFTSSEFRVDDFLSSFEFEPDAERIREEELRKAQAAIQAAQQELVDGQTDPQILEDYIANAFRLGSEDATEPEAGLSTAPAVFDGEAVKLATGSVQGALSAGLDAPKIASMRAAAVREHQVATLKAQWIKEQTDKISELVAATVPFYQEKAAAALAQTEEVRSYVHNLIKGIESLDLYVGKDVHVKRISTGASAVSSEPLTLVQRKLMVDEELAIWLDVREDFSAYDLDTFYEELKKSAGLVNQIFPTPRCILVMATTRRLSSAQDPVLASSINEDNKRVFILVRDGENVFRIDSPVESHLGTANLFPSRDQQEAQFKGIDGETVRFDDVAYGKHLAAHETFALHYKRLLLLICGLDHREKLFGDFYPEHMAMRFVSQEFQDSYCRFIHDEDGSGLIGSEMRPGSITEKGLKAWVKEKNSVLRPGSRVLCDFGELLNPQTAPAVCEANPSREFQLRYTALKRFDTFVVSKSKNDLVINVPVTSHVRQFTRRSEPATIAFNARVALNKYNGSYYSSMDQLGFLCLDKVEPEELHWFIHHRESRENHVYYISLFKRALQALSETRQRDATPLQKLQDAAANSGLLERGEDAKKALQAAAGIWRNFHRGAEIPLNEYGHIEPKAAGAMLELATTSRLPIYLDFANNETVNPAPLRLSIRGDGAYVLYCETPENQRINFVQEHVWVTKKVLRYGMNGVVSIKSESEEVLLDSPATEKTLFQWPKADRWLESSIKSRVVGGRLWWADAKAKRRLFEVIEGHAHRVSELNGPVETQVLLDILNPSSEAKGSITAARPIASDSHTLLCPIGVVAFGNCQPRVLCVGYSGNFEAALVRLAKDADSRKLLLDIISKTYRHPWRVIENLKLASEIPPELLLVAMESFKIDQNLVMVRKQGLVYTLPVTPKVSPLLSRHWETFKIKEGKNLSYYLAKGVEIDGGGLSIDAALGNQLPQGYSPTAVSVHVPQQASNPQVIKWFDVRQIDELQESSRSSSNSDWGVNPKGVNGWSAQQTTLITEKDVRNFMAEQTKQEEGVLIEVNDENSDLYGRPRKGSQRFVVVRSNPSL